MEMSNELASSSSNKLQELVQDLLAEAKIQGATAAEAGVSIESGLATTVRMGDVETIEHHRDKGLAITVYIGHRKGSASTSDFSPSAVRDTVKAALAIASVTTEDPYSGLADAALMAREIPDLDLCYPWAVTPEQAIELALECETAARDFDVRITNSEGASVSTSQGFRVYGNSHGFVGAYPSSHHSISCSVISQSGEAMQRDYWYSSARDPSEIEASASVGRQAAERALRRLNPRRLATGSSPVIFAAEVASSLLSHFIGAISGSSLYRKTSFLVDSLGKQIFPAHIRIDERPHLKKGLGSAPFDSEGVATRAHDIIRDGILQSYVLDSYAARKLGMQTTGNAGGVHNLFITTGNKDLPALLKTMGKGLLVTELMGQGVNRVTGDYSRGAAGFWIENGEIQYPVDEITIAGNLRDMLMSLLEIGNDVDTRRNTRTGSIFIEQMTIAGT